MAEPISIAAEATQITGLSEIAIGVADVRAAAEFYTDVVGLVLENVGSGGASLWTGAPDHSARLLLASRAQLPLPERAAPDGERRPGLAKNGPLAIFQPARLGPAHFALQVQEQNLPFVVKRLRDRSVELDGPVYFDWMKATSYYFLDRDGNLVELWSPTATAPDG